MADQASVWLDKNYSFRESLGEGLFGSVFRARRSAGNVFGQQQGEPEFVAVKVIKFNDVEGRLRDKAEIMKKFEHRAVVKLFNYFVDDANGLLYLEMELFTEGSLARDMESRQAPYPIGELRRLFSLAASALQDLHCVHGNIKPKNIFLTNGGRDMKLGEFHLSTLLNSSADLHQSTLRYMSPQALLNNPASFGDDVWSLGAVLYEMATNEPLFPGNSTGEVLGDILTGDRKQPSLAKITDENLRDLLSKMLKVEASDRCSISQVMTHPFVTGRKAAFSSISRMTAEEQIDFLNSQIIGRNLLIETCFGPKLKLYLDYTASGQELGFIVDKVTRAEELYANTHSVNSATGEYTNSLLAESEAAILKAFNADEKDYFLVCGGSGTTWGIEMAQKFLGTYTPPATREQMLKLFDPPRSWDSLKKQLRDQDQLPLVFVSHYEHSSNEVPWRNQLCDVVVCPPRQDGKIDVARLESNLKSERDRGSRRPIIGSLSAGSNVTGIKSDVLGVAKLLKKYGALALFDCAAVGPYVPIDLSRKTDDGRCLIDGIFLSPHKFLGGPGSSGILVFNRKIYNSKLEPTHGGCGTVSFVGLNDQTFHKDPALREKSGTPGILQITKAGLALQLKSILQPTIDAKERSHLERFYKETASWEHLDVLGPRLEKEKVCIMSFRIIHDDPATHHHRKTGDMRYYLHQNLIVHLLNDIFGIQARSGCSCAGPYWHYLLGIDDIHSEEYRFWLETHEAYNDNLQLNGFKPGWARVNLHFTMTDYEMDYLLFALRFLCDHGPRFLAVYNFDPVSGQWRHDGDSSKRSALFDLDAMPERRYAKSEEERRQILEKQREAAMALLDELPTQDSLELDAISEMPLCNFYVGKGRLLQRQLVEAKSAAFKKHFSDSLSSTPVAN